jgi:uncharacterized membrane protein YidH (DUF202 family)
MAGLVSRTKEIHWDCIQDYLTLKRFKEDYTTVGSEASHALRADLSVAKDTSLAFVVDDFINSCEKLRRANRSSLVWSGGRTNSYETRKLFGLVEAFALRSVAQVSSEDWEQMERGWKEKLNYYFVTEIYFHVAFVSVVVFTALLLFFVMIKVYGSAIGLREIFAHLNKNELDSLIDNCKKFEIEFLKEENIRPLELNDEKWADQDSQDRDEGLFEVPAKKDHSPAEKKAKAEMNPKETVVERKPRKKGTKTTAAIEKLFGRSKEETISLVKSLKKKGGAGQGIKLDLEMLKKKEPISKEVNEEIKVREGRLSDWGDYRYTNYVIRAFMCMALYFVPIGMNIYNNQVKSKQFDSLSHHYKMNLRTRNVLFSLRMIQFKHAVTGLPTLTKEGNDLRVQYEDELNDLLTELSLEPQSMFPSVLQDYQSLYKAAFSTSICQPGLPATLSVLSQTVESNRI